MTCAKDGKGKMGAEEGKILVYYSEEEELLVREMRHGKGIYIYVYVGVCMCACVCLSVSVCFCVCVCVYVYIYTASR